MEDVSKGLVCEMHADSSNLDGEGKWESKCHQ